MALTVVGSVAFDALETPFGKRERILGGAATHFGLSASFFTEVNAVGVVGGDFGDAEWDVFRRHRINTDDIEVIADGKTFFWQGRYDYDMNTAHTLDTQLNVFETFDPKLSVNSREADFLFLANILPMLQKQVREQMPKAKFVAMDTMNFWISSMKDALLETIKVVDCIVINDAEARQLTDEPNIHKAARRLMALGLKAVVIKRGEYGATLFTPGGFFVAPAYPLESVFDPTGAGDTFAGGFMGYLAATGDVTDDALRRAMVYGSVMASFNVEKFGTERVDTLDHSEINERFKAFKTMTHFDDIPFERGASA
ncbi:MAG: bifunctional hydroxymethylpyrimidine kinase/phosphomethylpyrimidine kinase [Chloracidobacterium sp.]|nr:bifunctional hydroxymethylpyrimidine kinase/phosphomethylpyrimidine kinase [Chloracidobacterium sp.]MCC6824616.1 bifunctional hydroxymethylpyrimidine kinase/phosphomethylpyrimidine kinase [Acidobacteriota bacterium]MCO5332857.1 PfkB family carbohydrate kinase [Pyrinomonadaceae bacterium]